MDEKVFILLGLKELDNYNLKGQLYEMRIKNEELIAELEKLKVEKNSN